MAGLAKGGAGPDVPKGDVVECESGGPDGGEAVDENGPQRGNVHASRGAVQLGLCLEEICVCLRRVVPRQAGKGAHEAVHTKKRGGRGGGAMNDVVNGVTM